MTGYYIMGGVLVIFFTGSLFIFMDMICNTEEEIIIRKPKQVVNKLTNYYTDDITED